jgi:hypothetical protein
LLLVLHPLKGQPNGFFAGLNVETWKLSTEKVWRIFHDEPGVLTLQNGGAVYKRRHRTLRLPESVLERVTRQLSTMA